jgi:hypothetical protein
MPEQAYDLQEFSFVTGIGRLFEELSLEEAREEAKGYIKQIRDTMQNSGMLGPLELMLDRYQSGDLVDVAFEDIFAAHPGPQQADDSSSPDAVLIEVIIAGAAECLSTNYQAPSDYSETDFTNLSKLITALRFLNVGFTAFQILAKRPEEIAFQEVVRGVIFVLGLDPNAVLSEARTALARLNEPEKPSLTEFIRNIPVNIKWKRAKDAHLDSARLISALSHPSWVVVEAAMNLLLRGVSSEELRPLTLQALDAEGNHVIPAVTALVSRLWKPDEAARILLNRLKGRPAVGFGHIYEALVQLIPECEAAVQNEIAWALLEGLYDDEHAAAVSAAQALSVLALERNSQLEQYLKHAFKYWMERVKREDLEASVHSVGSGKYRSSFRFVEPDPLVTLVKILTQFDALDTEQLLSLCSVIGELANEAIRLLTASAASDPDLMRSLLVRIKDGLKPYPSSTALNLLDALLGLPKETLQPVETELLAMTGAEIPSIRARLISSLTSEWTSHETAVNLAQAAIDDPAPGVRNGAVQILRLLKHPS